MEVCPMTKQRKAIFLLVTLLLTCLSTMASAAAWDGSSTSPTPHYKKVGGHDGGWELQYYTISTPEQLAGLRKLLDPGVPIYLTQDIWLNPDENPTERSFSPIGASKTSPFSGTFDGQGHTVHNLYINSPDRDNIGLFGRVQGATIKDLTVTGAVRGKTDVGGVVGYLDRGSISGVINKCSVQGYLEVGGVAGYAGGNIVNSQNVGGISSTYGAGGIAGSSAAAITGSVNTGTITVSETAAGGITSASSGTISDCENSGKVKGTQQTGGIVGALSGKVSDCRNNGEVSGSFYVGGIAARNYYGTISGSYNHGAVIAKNMAGGIVGYNDREGTVSNSHNKAVVTANILVAGVAGQNKGAISGCTSSGKITAQAYEYTGGIAGENDGTIDNSQYQEGTASGTVGDEEASTGTNTNSGAKDEDWFDKNVPDGGKTIILSGDVVIGPGEIYAVDNQTNVVLPGGVTLTDKGTLDNDGTVTVKKDGTLVIDTTGVITGDGVIIVETGGKVINNSDKPITIVTGDGSTSVVEPGKTYEQQTEQAVKPDTVLSADTTISKGETYPVAPGETLVIPADVTLTVEGTLANDGTVIIRDKGTLEIMESGKITGSGSIVVEAGGQIINHGSQDIAVVIDGKEYIVKPGETYTHRPTIYITAESESGGSISPAGKLSVQYGGTMTFAITPQTEYEIDNVAIDGGSVGAVTTYTFSNITEAHTIQAFFKTKPATGSTSVSSSGGCNSTGPKKTLYFLCPLAIYAGAYFMLSKIRKQPCEKNTEKE